jgi:DNA-binding NtrC family response regulator
VYRILLIEDDQPIRHAAEEVLHSLGHDVIGVSAAEAMWMLDKDPFDVVIACEAQTSDPLPEAKPLPTLIHLPRPLSPQDVAGAIDSLQQRDFVRQQLRQANDSLVKEVREGEPIVGRSSAMQRVLDMIAAVGDSEAPVLLTGESGTGKDLLARTIHVRSSRKEKPFVVVNCAAFPETLLEAELFGYERGAFTGALQKREGRFKAADGGTLFLDEVNSLSLAAQAKLLRVLHDGTFQPIGTNATLSVNVRLVSATNRNLKALVGEAKFREDLYYRIKVLDIDVPPLRDRRGDVPLLVQYFLKKYSGEKPSPSVSPRAWAALMQHGFPGNVRELEHAIHHALVLSRGEEIDVEHLPQDVSPVATGPVSVARPDEGELRPLADAMGEFEREYLLRALRAAGGNKTKAARLLGISRKNLWHKLTRVLSSLDIEPEIGTNLELGPPREVEWRPVSGNERGPSSASDPTRRGRRRATRSTG